MTARQVKLDGGMLEGGGQILRNGAALAAVTGTTVTVDNIRAGRAKPGLAAQHLTGLQLVTALSGGSLAGGAVRSSSITLEPQLLTCGSYSADIRTAGSCSLLVQTVLPCLLFAQPAAHGVVPPDHTTAHNTRMMVAQQSAAPPAVVEAASQQLPPHMVVGAGGPHNVGSPASHDGGAEHGQAGTPHAISSEHAAGEASAQGKQGLAPITEEAAPETSTLTLKGGTDASQAPPIDYVLHVLLPVLHRSLAPHLDVQVQLVRRGFYPRGGGEIILTARCLPPGQPLPAVNLTNPGHVTGVDVHVFTAGRLPHSLGQLLADDAEREVLALLHKHGHTAASRGNSLSGAVDSINLQPGNNWQEASMVPITKHVVHEPPERALGDGGGLSIVVHTSTGCILGANALLDRSQPAEALAVECVTQLDGLLSSGACVDEWLQDQLIIFMALAEGTSRIKCTEPTLHSRTAMVVAETLTGAQFKVMRPKVEGRAWLVECHGVGQVRSAAAAGAGAVVTPDGLAEDQSSTFMHVPAKRKLTDKL